MSSTTDNTATPIEDKKNKNETSSSSSDTKSLNWGGFLKSLIITIIFLFVWIGVIGAIILYLCKLSQANILPSDMNSSPYTDLTKVLDQIPINVNINKVKDKHFSTKIFYNQKSVLNGYEKGFLGYLRSWKENPKRANFYSNYLTDVLFNMFSFNYEIVDNLFGLLNESVSETIILLISPFILLLLFIGIYLSNIGLAFFYQLKYFQDFFSKKHTKDGKVEWEKGNMWIAPFRWLFIFFYAIFLFFPTAFLSPILTTNYTLFSPLFIKANLVSNNKEYSFFQFFGDNLFYKSSLILILFSIFISFSILTYLNTYYFISFLIAVAILAYKHFYQGKNLNEDPKLSAGLVPVKKASFVKEKMIEMTNIKKGGNKKVNKK